MGYEHDEVGLALLYQQAFHNEVMKMGSVQYNVFLNGDYLGNLPLEKQETDTDPITHLLKEKGYSNLITQIHGDNYLIHAENNQASSVKSILSDYLMH